MTIYHFVYKTTHTNGRYYIGRHSTNNINDGYLGSGRWVSGIKNKTNLSRNVIEFAQNIEELKLLEELHIQNHWDDPMCMNKTKSSAGVDSETASKLNTDRVKNGTNPFMKRSDGTSVTSDRVKNGTNPFMKRSDGTSIQTDRVKNGNHHLLKQNGGSDITKMSAINKVKNGTHPWQTRPDGSNHNTDKVISGTHHFLKRPDGSSISSDMVKNGIHTTQKNWTCPHCNVNGKGMSNYKRWHSDNCKYKKVVLDDEEN